MKLEAAGKQTGSTRKPNRNQPATNPEPEPAIKPELANQETGTGIGNQRPSGAGNRKLTTGRNR